MTLSRDRRRAQRLRRRYPRPDASVFDGAAVRAVAKRGGRGRASKACSERLPATLASIEAGQQLDQTLIEPAELAAI
jgi:hypothetical protein